MKCVIIDDEPIALGLLEGYISKIPFLDLVASCTSGFEAMKVFQEHEIDLVFTDIEMPNFSGIDIAKSMDNSESMFIFTTGHSHYAIEGFDLNITDYLMKPIPFYRFLKAASRAHDVFNLKKEKLSNIKNNLEQDFIFVKNNN